MAVAIVAAGALALAATRTAARDANLLHTPVRHAAGIGHTAQAPTLTHFLPVIAAPGPVNLLVNGDFERGTLDGWEAGNTATVELSTEEAHDGRYAACLANAGLRSAWVPVEPGAAYKLTAWIKIVEERETGDDLWGGFRLAVADYDWQTLAQRDDFLAATHGSDWVKAALTFTATTDAVLVDAGYFGGGGREQRTCIDDIALFRKRANQPPAVTATLSPARVPGGPAMQAFAVTGDDPDGAIARVLWEFGDGTRALSASGTRRVAATGRFTATVRVADDEGAVAVRTVRWEALDASAPTLAVAWPAAAHTTVASPTLLLTGTAGPTVTDVGVSSDRNEAVAADGTAQWQALLPLRPGANRILVQATDADGRIATDERIVRYVPPGRLALRDVDSPPTAVRWDPLEITFDLANSAATHPHLPYEPTPRPGLGWVDGVSVDVHFTPDAWQTVYTRPAFRQQRYDRALKDGREWLYPAGDPVWMVRFAPPLTGVWQYRIEAREAKGVAASAIYSFTVSAADSAGNHGPIGVAAADTRYFEFADGTPFLGAGHGTGFDAERFSYAATDLFDTVGGGNQNFFRWWLGGAIWGSAWQPWRSRTLEPDGYVPATGLTLDRAYGDGLASLRLDRANPIMFYGFDSGWPGLVDGRTYRLRVRWRTEGIDSPVDPALPYGVALKFTGWPEVGETAAEAPLTAHVHGDTPWHVAEADFTASGSFPDDYITLAFENASGGAAYVDAVTLQEVRPDGTLGPQLLRSPRMNSHLTFDDRRAAGVDAILREANERGIYFKLVISEKDEWLVNHLGPEGLPDPLGGNFFNGAGTPAHWLHAAYWRYLSARYGAFRAVHSWELVNETAPGFGDAFLLAADLARMAAADGNPHLASASTWATLAEDAWLNPAAAPIGYVDFHAYVNGTGWIEPKDELTADSARFFADYDQAALAAGFGKPVVWGELGIDGTATTDEEDPRLAEDVAGVWLHKLTWARLGPGGVYPLYWYTDNIFAHALHPIFGAWRRFMEDIPLTNGRYEDAAATVTNPDLRVLGQKDTTGGRAHLWIDNRNHTWRAVVDGASIAPVSGAVTVAMGEPYARYRVEWFDTVDGLPTTTETVIADSRGFVVLSLMDLATDIAVKLERQ
ncbi:MAG: PKD domain-containing protein [Caldilinea sp.]|nr:PKD domain-containing protein [Caldilinea sp.]